MLVCKIWHDSCNVQYRQLRQENHWVQTRGSTCYVITDDIDGSNLLTSIIDDYESWPFKECMHNLVGK